MSWGSDEITEDRGGWHGSDHSLEALDRHRRQQPDLKHGLQVKTLLQCDTCPHRRDCPTRQDGAEYGIERGYLQDRLRELARLPHVDGLADEAQIQKAAFLEILTMRGLRFLAAEAAASSRVSRACRLSRWLARS